MQLKKQAIDLTDLAVSIIVLGVVVTIGSLILINMRDTRLTELSTQLITNETVTATGDYFSNTWYKSLLNCLNGTDLQVVSSGNYTITPNSIDGSAYFTNATSSYNATTFRCSYYIYDTNRSDWSLANDSAIGLGEYGNWFKIITIVGVAAVVLAIIFMAFGRGSGSVGGSSGSSGGMGGQGY